jgi:hypothetical protein
MTNFLRKLMFWRKSPDGEASSPVPTGGADDSPSPTQEELDYEAEREEKYLEERREQDDVAP